MKPSYPAWQASEGERERVKLASAETNERARHARGAGGNAPRVLCTHTRAFRTLTRAFFSFPARSFCPLSLPFRRLPRRLTPSKMQSSMWCHVMSILSCFALHQLSFLHVTSTSSVLYLSYKIRNIFSTGSWSPPFKHQYNLSVTSKSFQVLAHDHHPSNTSITLVLPPRVSKS